MKTAIIYNKFCLDSLIATAILKDKIENVKIFDNTKDVPNNFDKYIWIGLNPLPGKGTFIDSVKEKEHEYIELKVNMHEIEKHLKPTLIELVSEQYHAYNQITAELAYAVTRFYEKDASKKELTLVFSNMKAAENAIIYNEPYEPLLINNHDEDDLNDYFKFIKQKVAHNFHLQYVRVGKFFKLTAVTSITEDYFWCTRMLMLAHNYVTNIILTPMGCIVDSNLGDISELKIDVATKTAYSY